jgi:hypothetical protein
MNRSGKKVKKRITCCCRRRLENVNRLTACYSTNILYKNTVQTISPAYQREPGLMDRAFLCVWQKSLTEKIK